MITVVPARGALPHLADIDETALAPFITAPSTVLLRGIITAVPPDKTLWLALPGAGAVSLVATRFERYAALRTSVQRWGSVRGVCLENVIVHAVQAEAD